ncbi:FadR/GntR family transcriptional regulator [Oceanobacillus jeddahense]|uniref:FadR/GntR family transcriptional regulator n=1 Tax=Oceanobacillus jeddahense TaxID=1462527 RepID=UPI000595C07A|nr:FadR/GntR family transcriptional regulator [Oceanobacillus jeddahense]
MHFNSIDREDIVTNVFNQLKEQILNGNWEPGSKIPSEPQLKDMFNVSRVSIRSALQRLRDIGAIVTYQGKGSFVAENIGKFSLNDFGLNMHLSKQEFLDMLVFRETIEFKCIELAAENANEQDIQEIKQALDEMIRHKDNYKEYTTADFQFHLAIAKASKNKVFYDVFQSIKDFYYYYLEELNRVIGITPKSVDAHIELFQALENKDANAAKQILSKAMQTNINILNNEGTWEN